MCPNIHSCWNNAVMQVFSTQYSKHYMYIVSKETFIITGDNTSFYIFYNYNTLLVCCSFGPKSYENVSYSGDQTREACVGLHSSTMNENYKNMYLMFLWQVEFWLAKKLLLTLHGSRAVYFIRHIKSIIALAYCLCCVFHLHYSKRHTYGTENQ